MASSKRRNKKRKTKAGSIRKRKQNHVIRTLPPPFLSAANENLRGGLKILPLLLKGKGFFDTISSIGAWGKKVQDDDNKRLADSAARNKAARIADGTWKGKAAGVNRRRRRKGGSINIAGDFLRNDTRAKLSKFQGGKHNLVFI
jgi:hypothetical protein